jgi:SAM-dependent methyltransferase
MTARLSPNSSGFSLQRNAPPTKLTIYDQKFFAAHRDRSLRSARVIVPRLLSHINVRSVVDIGCGLGTWLRAFQESGVADVAGYDGAYIDRAALLIDERLFSSVDLREDFSIPRRFDLAISLEVAEHLPENCANSLVYRLTTVAPAVLFSAAIPGQGGREHLNEQWQDYWRNIFSSYSFYPVDLIRPSVRGRSDVELCYQQEAYASVSGSAISGGTASEYGVEQISNISRFGRLP